MTIAPLIAARRYSMRATGSTTAAMRAASRARSAASSGASNAVSSTPIRSAAAGDPGEQGAQLAGAQAARRRHRGGHRLGVEDVEVEVEEDALAAHRLGHARGRDDR